MMTFTADQCTTDLFLGRQGENLATQIIFAVPEDLQQYAAFVYVLRNGDDTAYPAANVVVADGSITWTITSIETLTYGAGEVQIRFVDDETIVKTIVFRSFVSQSIDMDAGDVPDPYETWLDSLVELAAETQQAARAAKLSEDNAKTSEDNAKDSEEQAEAWATGTINGQAVPPSAEQRMNNAKYYSIQAQLSANASQQSRYESRTYSQDSKAWAIGVRNSQPVPSTDETYENNSKYYAELAQQAADDAGYIHFYIDENGDLIYVKTPYVALDFKLQDGDLYVGV